jgi:hypothetical protein
MLPAEIARFRITLVWNFQSRRCLVIAGVVESGALRCGDYLSLADGTAIRIGGIEFVDPPREAGEIALRFAYENEDELSKLRASTRVGQILAISSG